MVRVSIQVWLSQNWLEILDLMELHMIACQAVLTHFTPRPAANDCAPLVLDDVPDVVAHSVALDVEGRTFSRSRIKRLQLLGAALECPRFGIYIPGMRLPDGSHGPGLMTFYRRAFAFNLARDLGAVFVDLRP